MADLTYAQLIARVTENLNRDDLDTVARTFIQERIEHYGKEYFYSAENLDNSITTSAGTRYYALPSRWAAVNAVRALVGSQWVDLEKVSNDELDEIDVLNAPLQSQPAFWCLFSGQLRVFPCGPNYNLELTMDRSPAPPVADADVTFWSTDAQLLIISSSCEAICNDYLNDPVRADKHKSRRIDAENSLNSKSIKAKGGIRFQPYL